jgi:hypothetical protein
LERKFYNTIPIMSEQKKTKTGQINIELEESVAQGIYSNLAIINHSQSEFVLDFISVMPGVPKSKVKSRIILTPQHAKRFLKAVQDNIQRFEAANGEIKDYHQAPMPINFGPTGEA